MDEFTPLIYIAGPYSGENVANTQRAVQFAEHIEAAYAVNVFIPHLTMLWDLISPAPYAKWLDRDLAYLDRCDALIRMDGTSSGADAEYEHARNTLGIPVFRWVELDAGERFRKWLHTLP